MKTPTIAGTSAVGGTSTPPSTSTSTAPVQPSTAKDDESAADATSTTPTTTAAIASTEPNLENAIADETGSPGSDAGVALRDGNYGSDSVLPREGENTADGRDSGSGKVGSIKDGSGRSWSADEATQNDAAGYYSWWSYVGWGSAEDASNSKALESVKEEVAGEGEAEGEGGAGAAAAGERAGVNGDGAGSSSRSRENVDEGIDAGVGSTRQAGAVKVSSEAKANPNGDDDDSDRVDGRAALVGRAKASGAADGNLFCLLIPSL